jgi:tetratricopeptide (TPR) repeat protein
VTTQGRPLRIPAKAERMRLPLWQRSQTRLRERYGFDLGDRDAMDKVRALVAEHPDDAELRLLLAAAQSVGGDAAMAEAEVRRALDLQPRLARARTTLATLLVQRGAYEEGLNEARNAAALDMKDPTILFNLGLAEWFAGERKTARAAFDRAAEALDPPRATGDASQPRRRWPWQRRRDG